MINNIQDTENIKNSINLMAVFGKNYMDYNITLINIFKTIHVNNIAVNFNKLYIKIISSKLGYNKYD